MTTALFVSAASIMEASAIDDGSYTYAYETLEYLPEGLIFCIGDALELWARGIFSTGGSGFLRQSGQSPTNPNVLVQHDFNWHGVHGGLNDTSRTWHSGLYMNVSNFAVRNRANSIQVSTWLALVTSVNMIVVETLADVGRLLDGGIGVMIDGAFVGTSISINGPN